MHQRSIHGACALSALALTSALPALAAPPETAEVEVIQLDEKPAPPLERAPETLALDEIVVTGEKIARSLEQTTASAAVIDGASLEAYNDASVSDLFRRLGNVTASQDGTFSIRGVGNTGPEGFTYGQPVITQFIDGVAVDRIGQFTALSQAWDIERVEVLRGPQSTAQGRNALAGAVITTTRDPTEFWEARARARFAELGTRQLAIAGGGPLGGGLSFRVAGDHRQSDGFVTNTTLDDPEWGATGSRLGRAKLAYRPRALPALEVVATAMVGEADNGNDGSSVEYETADAAPRTAQDNTPGASDRIARLYSLRARYDIAPDVSLHSTTAYLDTRDVSRRDFDRSAAGESVTDTDFRGRTVSQELRVNYEALGALRGIVGVYAGRFDDDRDIAVREGRIRLSDFAPLPLADSILRLHYDSTSFVADRAENLAVFAEVDWAISERLTATFGLRYDTERREITSEYSTDRVDASLSLPGQVAGLPVLGPALDALLDTLPPLDVGPLLSLARIVPGTSGRQHAASDYDAWLPKLGLRYALTDRLTAFATYTEAYRAGGVDILFTTGELAPFEPEFTRNYEVGLRGRAWNERLRYALNVYYVDWRDQQVEILTADGAVSYTENAASSTLWGSELSLTARLARGWHIDASLGYAHTRFDHYETINGDYAGNRFVRAPEFTAGLGTAWRDAAGWFASGSVAYTGDYFVTPENDPRETSDAYTLIDARAGYAFRFGSVAVFVRNALDDDYATYRFRLEPGPGVEIPGTLIAHGPPRILGIALELRY